MDPDESHPYDVHTPCDLYSWLYSKAKKHAPGPVDWIIGWVNLICLNLNKVKPCFVKAAAYMGSDTFLKVMSSLPLFLVCWFEGLIFFGAISMGTTKKDATPCPCLAPSPSPSEQPKPTNAFLVYCLGVLVVSVLINTIINGAGYIYYKCCNWHLYRLVVWLKRNVVGKKVQGWVFSNSLMNLSVLLIAGHHAHIIICFGAFSLGLAATICLVHGKKDDMGILDGLVTCFYICSLTFLSTDPHRLLVTTVSVIVLLFLLICTTGPWHQADSHDEEKGPREKEGDENGDVSLQQEVSELRKELDDVKEYVKSIKQCHCHQPKSFEYKKPESVRKSDAYIIRGFDNFNRNCFFSAVIQVLLCIPHLRVPFMKLNDYDRPLTRAVKELFIETSLPPVSHCDERFRNLYYCFCAKCPQFGDGQDQDSQEFLVCLLQRLREEEEDLVQTIQNSPPLLVYSIFGGQVLNTTSCRMYNCRYTNKQDEPFLQILLPIPVTGDLSRASMVGNKDATVSLITCLDQYIELEFLPGRRCDRCCCTGGNKSIRVICAPLILTISLKRFNAENKKINDHIIFEETFDLRAYMDDRYVGSDKLEYHLIGVVVHEGSVNTGHCFAYVRGDKSGGSKEDNEDFTWYCLNDLVVREVSLGEVLQSQAYMLFYEKRTSAPQTCTPISNHGSSKQRHRRSRSTTYGSGKKVSSERPWKSPDEASYSSWRYSSLEDLKGNGGGRWRSDD